MISLEYICQKTVNTKDDWIIIGSAAAFLSGVDLTPQDVDFCAPAETIRTIIGAGIGENHIKSGQKIFSNPYETIEPKGGLPIDFMGDLSIQINGNWRKMSFVSRKVVSFAFGDIYIPEIWEQIEILKAFGRSKDLAKLPMLQALL